MLRFVAIRQGGSVLARSNVIPAAVSVATRFKSADPLPSEEHSRFNNVSANSPNVNDASSPSENDVDKLLSFFGNRNAKAGHHQRRAKQDAAFFTQLSTARKQQHYQNQGKKHQQPSSRIGNLGSHSNKSGQQQGTTPRQEFQRSNSHSSILNDGGARQPASFRDRLQNNRVSSVEHIKTASSTSLPKLEPLPQQQPAAFTSASGSLSSNNTQTNGLSFQERLQMIRKRGAGNRQSTAAHTRVPPPIQQGFPSLRGLGDTVSKDRQQHTKDPSPVRSFRQRLSPIGGGNGENRRRQPRSDPATKTNTGTGTRGDLSDVSALRDAFLQSLQINKAREEQQRQQEDERRRRRRGGLRDALTNGTVSNQSSSSRAHRRFRQNNGNSFFETAREVDRRVEKRKRQQEMGSGTRRQVVDEEKQITLPRFPVSLAHLSALMRVKRDDLVRTLRGLGVYDVKDDEDLVDVEMVELVALELEFDPVRSPDHESDENVLMKRRASSEESLRESLDPRPPVVCIMGHVDHGKTTLMDSLRRRAASAALKHSRSNAKKKAKSKTRKSNSTKEGDMAGTEAGGITQVISAFQIPLETSGTGGSVTFLDTPGHAAFKSMREWGTYAADVIVLVIAADDGVSPQTIEVLDCYKQICKETGVGGISLVVAMNKIDKPGIDVDEATIAIENQLLEHGVYTERMASSTTEKVEYGPVQLVPVSGLTGAGLEDLIEGLALQSEVMDLRADTSANAEGIIIDARVEKGLGVVCDCIVRWGSLKRGEYVVSGSHSGKIKVLNDVYGKRVDRASPSQPVRVVGFGSLPAAGDPIISVNSEEEVDELVEKEEFARSREEAESFRADGESNAAADLQVMGVRSAETLHKAKAELMGENRDEGSNEIDNVLRIPVVIKADAHGTLEAVRLCLIGLGEESSRNLVVDPVSAGIGPLSATDIRIAQDSGAAIFTFNVGADRDTGAMAESQGVQVRSHNVIYSLLDDAKVVFAEKFPAVLTENLHGSGVVREVFNINNKKNKIAGLQVTDGVLYKTKSDAGVECLYRVLRDGEPLDSGEKLTADSLRHVKEDVEEIRRGKECGLGLTGFTDLEQGDVIECYSVEMKQQFF